MFLVIHGEYIQYNHFGCDCQQASVKFCAGRAGKICAMQEFLHLSGSVWVGNGGFGCEGFGKGSGEDG